MFVILAVHALVAAAAVVTARHLGPRVFWLCALAPLTTLGFLAANASTLLDGGAVTSSLQWVPALDLEIAFRVDAFSALMLTLVSGIGLLIFTYASAYFGHRSDLARLSASLVLFSAAMIGVVTADHLLALFVFWELTTITSYSLIATDDGQGSARAAALQAILTTTLAGLAMLGGFVLLGQTASTYTLSAILADPPGGTATSIAAGLILIGALAKSAQFPFHYWLPGAMAAPTPVSAYLHSATMVKAGVYLIARFAPAMAPLLGWWRPTVMGLGLITMVWGGYRALRQTDLKLLLANGTVSQLGFMVVLLGAGVPELTFAGTAVLFAHGLFKASLFMSVGIVDHQCHTREIHRLTGLGRRMRPLLVVTALAAASMAGLPPLLGFVAKEAAFEGLLHAGPPADLVLAVVVGASALTVAYTARLMWGAFADTTPAAATGPLVGPEAPQPSSWFLTSPALLSGLSLVLALGAAATTTFVAAAAGALDAEAADGHLYLWHGFTPALGLSVVGIAAGAGLFAARHRVEAFQRRAPVLANGTRAYERCVAGLNTLAKRTTAITQNGSLPTYLGVVLCTAVVLPGVPLLFGESLPRDLVLAESPVQAVVAGLVIAGAVTTALARRRFVAVLTLGAVGFGLSVLYVVQGAPDLALTQLLIETLTLVIFVQVLRHLPERFNPPRWRATTTVRVAIAVAVGVFASAFALIAASARTAPTIASDHLERALPEAGGRNVVNVILVDFRGFDTMGEITVLVVAALGVASLVLVGRRARAQESRP